MNDIFASKLRRNAMKERYCKEHRISFFPALAAQGCVICAKLGKKYEKSINITPCKK